MPASRPGEFGSPRLRRRAEATVLRAMDFDDEESGSLVKYWKTLFRYKGTVVLISFLGTLAAFLLTVPQTPVYQARTSLEIQNLNENFLNMRDLSPTASAGFYSPDYDIQTQTRKLLSRSLLERVISRHDDLRKRILSNNKESSRAFLWRKVLGLPKEEKPLDRGASVAAAAASLADALKVRPQSNTRIVDVTVDSTSPQLAAEVANAITAEFIDLGMEERWQSNQRTSEWLTRQMQDLKIKLEKSEEQLQGYMRAASLLFTSEKNNVTEERLHQLQEELSRAQADRVAKQSRYELASTVPPESLPEVLDDPTLKDYQVELTTLRRQLAELSSSYTSAYPKVAKVQAQITAVETALEKKRANIIARVRNEFDSARRREHLLTADYTAQVRLMTDQADKVSHYNTLKREVDSTRQLYDSMFQRVKEAGVASALRASNVQVVDPARPPTAAYKPNFVLNTAFGFVSGFLLAIAVVFVRDRADRTIQAPGDATLYLNVPELGVIPSDAAQRRRLRRPQRQAGSEALSTTVAEKLELAAFQKRLSPISEAFRVALTSILFSEHNGGHPRVIAVSSASCGDGKTTVCSNLAIALAQASQRVLLIDGDLRRPRMHSVFDVDNSTGFSDVLAGRSMLTVRESGVCPNLFLLPGGSDSDANLLFTPVLGELMRRLRNEFDMILVDTPPLLQMPDARILGRHADAVILVVRAQHTTRDSARLACERLEADGIPLLGTILNNWNPAKATNSYGYGADNYSYRYTDRDRPAA